MEDKFVLITEEQLDNLIYFATLRATKRALDKHFRGLLPFLNQINSDNEKILEELEFLKLSQRVETLVKEEKKEVKPEKKIPVEFNNNNILGLDKMTDEEKEKLIANVADALKNNQLNAIRIPEIQFPDIKKGFE